MLPSHEQTLSLLHRAQLGDAQAREALVLQNTPLVKSIVKRFLGRGSEYEDLFQLGSLGLLKAIEGFDPSFGVRFSTYAVPMITGEIRRFLRDDGPLKVSRHLKQQASLLFSLQEQLKESFGREPTLEELSQAAGISPEEVVLALDACRIPRSIEEPIFEDQPDSSTLGDTLPAQEDDFCIDKLLLKEQLSLLTPRERQIILLRYFSDKTQSEIASLIGVSQVQISRILQKTLQKLRQSFFGS